MLFFIMTNANVNFQAWDLEWGSYTIRNILLTITRVGLIGKNKFAAAILDLEHEAFVLYVVAFSVNLVDEVRSLWKAQIVYVKGDEASIKVPNKYANFADVFSPKLVIELPKHTKINDHAVSRLLTTLL